jgi:hypothetical protein
MKGLEGGFRNPIWLDRMFKKIERQFGGGRRRSLTSRSTTPTKKPNKNPSQINLQLKGLTA